MVSSGVVTHSPTNESVFFYLTLSGAESSQESGLGFWFLGAPERSSWSAGERVHPATRLSPSRCCFPALPCSTATQTGQYWRLSVCCFWSQHHSLAHWLLKLSHVGIIKNGQKYITLSTGGPRWRAFMCWVLFKELIKGAASGTCEWNLNESDVCFTLF